MNDLCVQGGSSVSSMEVAPDVGPKVSRWKGTLITEVRQFLGSFQAVSSWAEYRLETTRMREEQPITSA